MALHGPFEEGATIATLPSLFSLSPSGIFALLLLICTFVWGCTVPLGAGFRLSSRQLSFPTLSSTPGPLHLRITDRMQNDGNRALGYLDVSAPIAPARTNLIVRVDGKTVEPTPISDDPGAPLRIRFVPPWRAEASHEIGFEYDLSTEPVRGGVAGTTPEALYLADPRALPFWLTPVGLFSTSELLERDERLDLTVPADFHVITSERQARSRVGNGNHAYSFRTSGKDIAAFVIAGRYHEQVIETRHGALVLWTLQPIDRQTIQSAAERLTYTAAIFRELFGPSPDPGALRVVEAPENLFTRDASGQSVLAASFPKGILLSSRAFDMGIGTEPVIRAAEAELVRAWFGWRVPLRLDVEVLLGRGLGIFAVAIAAEWREGPQALRREVMRILADYDRAKLPNDDESLLQSPEDSTPQQLAANSLKSALFLAALHDLSGAHEFEMALHRLQDAMVGRGVSLYVDDLRAAVENTMNRPIPEVFRQWLSNPGIPDDFRARYTDGVVPQAREARTQVGRLLHSGGVN